MTQPTEWDISALRLQGDLPAYLRRCHAEALAIRKRQRAKVLADPELAAQLVDVLRLTSADQWSGYLPPERDCNGIPNRSPIRAALVQIVAEAGLRSGS